MSGISEAKQRENREISFMEAEWQLSFAQFLSNLSFRAGQTQASQAAELRIEGFDKDGLKRIPALTCAQCNEFASDLNVALRSVLDKYQLLTIERAKALIAEETKIITEGAKSER